MSISMRTPKSARPPTFPWGMGSSKTCALLFCGCMGASSQTRTRAFIATHRGSLRVGWSEDLDPFHLQVKVAQTIDQRGSQLIRGECPFAGVTITNDRYDGELTFNCASTIKTH